MKLEWGKKVTCPECNKLFYTMQKTTLVCPGCGNQFDLSEITNKKIATMSLDIDTEMDDKATLSSFGFPDSSDDIGLEDDTDLAENDVFEDIKLIDNE